MDVVATQYLLGVRPVLQGLLIDPSIPAEWESYTVHRIFRGCRLTIKVENPDHVQHGVKELVFNGKPVILNDCALITSELLASCKEAQIKVVMG